MNVILEVEGGEVETVQVQEKPPLVSTTTDATARFDAPGLASPRPRAESARTLVTLAPPDDDDANALTEAAAGRELTFRAATRDTIAADQARRVPLGRYAFQVKTERHLYPAVASTAYLSAELRGPSGSPLPAGRAKLSVGADSAGEAALGFVVPGQPFTIPLGVDQALRAVRRVTQQTRSEGLLRKRDVTRYTVTSEVANPHPWPVKVIVHEQLPISSDGTVEVKLAESSHPPRHDPKAGALAFTLTIPASAARTLRFAYTLARPRGHRLLQTP
jgi:uncharacterized protein (TIGR02231 family)